MGKGKGASILEHFEGVEDPRIELKTDHKLIDIIMIAICGVICGADSWTDIEGYGQGKRIKILLRCRFLISLYFLL